MNRREMFFKAISHALKMPPDLSLTEWSDKNRKLSKESSAEHGDWVTSRTPYMLEIYDSVMKARVRKVVLQFGSQLAKTEFILNSFGWYANLDPCPMMVVQPTDRLASEFSKERVAPMIRDCEVLRELIKDSSKKNSGNTVTHKMFPGGFLAFKGANSPAGLASKPVKVLFMDEVDRYPKSSGDEGSPITLAEKRVQTYDDHKIIITGTPTIKGQSEIETEYEKGSMARYFVACPICGDDNELLFDNLSWDLNENDILKVDKVEMICEHCGCGADEESWKDEKGRWIHEYPERTTLSYKLSALASVMRDWKSIVEEYLSKKDNEQELISFVNTVLGESYEQTLGEILDHEILMQRRETYEAEVPEGVLLLTAGVDVQDGWLAIEVVGHGMDNETWGIQYKILSGNLEKSEIWEELDEFLSKKFYYEDGTGINIYSTCIDTGGHHTEAVYDFVKPRETHRRIFGIKGLGGENVPIINGFRLTKNKKINLLSLGVNALKDMTMGRLKISEPGPGYCHYPLDPILKYDERYFKALTAETKTVNKKNWKVTWTQVRKRNEALDCRNYALAAKEIFTKLDMNKLAKLRREQLGEIFEYKISQKKKHKIKIEGGVNKYD
ncbi:phage terminase large subunit family protein [Cetobacterium sp. ZOR0034]|uniref:phage terminase large subunit family protein n=1 Tax=Cetobacterium sp. ZOR0034 TaxID=1339239 RepID=UPI00068F917C|nr:terminase gpA endonuclease subunit [Cetobacterium sp. ZOR0034]